MIKHNGKKCQVEGCDSLLFAKCKNDPDKIGRCKYHYNSYNALRNADTFKKVSIVGNNKKKSQRASKASVEERVDWGFITEIDMFIYIWAEAQKKTNNKITSTISGRSLMWTYKTDFWYNCFAHVLSKAQNKFPYFKLNPDNIMLLHPEEHNLIDQGNKDQRLKYEEEHNCSFDIFFEKRTELIEEYGRFKKQKCLR